jgi:hypothetical protein
MGDTDNTMVKRNFKLNPLTAEEVQMLRWYVVIDDLIGGHLIATVNKPASQIDPYAGEFEVATFIAQGMAQHVVDLHNTWLDSFTWGSYEENIALSDWSNRQMARFLGLDNQG